MSNRATTTYVAVVCVLAAAALGLLYNAEPAAAPSFVRAAVVFCALGTFAHLLGYQLARGAFGSIAFIPYLALVALSPNWIAVTAIGLSMTVAECFAKRPLQKSIFNVAQQTLAGALAVWAYGWTGGPAMLESALFAFGPFLVLLTTFTLANTLAVSGVVGLSEERSVWSVWRENTARTITYDLLSLPVVFAFAWVYVQWGAPGVALLAVPVLGIRQLYISNWQLERANQELLELMVAAIEARDPYTSGHSRRVAHYSKIVARAIGLGGRDVDRIGVAALLHDVGKIHEIFAPILRKPDRLSPEEWEIMKTHPVKSAELAQHVSQLRDVVPALKHHHENWDGTGYPDGVAGELIPLYARVIMFADTIDAMTTDRPYRAALDEAAVRAELVRMRGRQFDPRICDVLLSSSLFSSIFDQRIARGTPRTIAGDLSSERIRRRA